MYTIVPFLILFFLANVADFVSTILSLSVGNIELNPIFHLLGESIILFGLFKLFGTLFFIWTFYEFEVAIYDKYEKFLRVPSSSVKRLFYAHLSLYLVVSILIILFTWLALHNISISTPYL